MVTPNTYGPVQQVQLTAILAQFGVQVTAELAGWVFWIACALWPVAIWGAFILDY